MATRHLPDRTVVTNAIDLHTDDSPARVANVLATATDLADADRESVEALFERLRKQGEIYSYENEHGVHIVKNTNEVVADAV